MAFVDDLNKAVGMFNQGVEKFATTQAFSRASEQIAEINTNMKDGLEKRQALQGASQQLAQDLLQSGAPVQRVQAAFQAFGSAPLTSPAEQIQVGVEQQAPELVQQGQEIQREQTRVAQEFKALQTIRKQQLSLNKDLGKENRNRIDQRQREFNRLTKEHFKALDQATSAASALELENPIADSAIKTMLAKASGEVGNLTEAEREMFAGSPALTRKAARLAKLSALGTLPASDRKDLVELLNTYQQNAKKGIKRNAEIISKQITKTTNLSKEEALKTILPDLDAAGIITDPAPGQRAGGQPANAAQPARSSGFNFRNFFED